MTAWQRRLIAIGVALIPVVGALSAYFFFRHRAIRLEGAAPQKPEAPPDLEKLRPAFTSGLDALRRGDGATAVRQFSSFKFGGRAVEEYRLYFLASAFQISGDRRSARRALARLWSHPPHLVNWEDISLNLGNFYSDVGDWDHAIEVYRGIASRTDRSPVAAAARWQLISTGFAAGDPKVVYDAAHDIVVNNPRAPQAVDAIAILRALSSLSPTEPLKLTDSERLQRAVSLMRDGDPKDALPELNALEASTPPPDLRLPVQLNRGLALNQLRRYEESNRLLEPMVSGPFKFAIPAIYNASKNYRAMSASINPLVNKIIIVKQRVGSIRVPAKGKKKAVVKPKFANVKKTIQVVDPAKKAKKEEYESLSNERLHDLLSLPLADEVRIEVLNTLIALAESKNDDALEQKLITDLAKLDPSQEAGLQHFWGKAWEAYTRGDGSAADRLLTFVHDTYRNPNVKRQASYWMARTMERQGMGEQAAAIYRSLADAPYSDLYAFYCQAHGAHHQDLDINPLKMQKPDWPEIAEKDMPSELRLAYELTALTDSRDARLEIQKNLKRSNQKYADALLADLYNSYGDMLLMMRSARRAFPQLATVEQDVVPAYFLKMYYPMKYRDAIIANAQKNNLDPFLVMGLIHQESTYNPLARSPVGASGLMQLMPATAKEIARRTHSSANTEDPEVNIRLGTVYFRQLVNMFGGVVQLAVASYNAGMGNVMRWRRGAPHKPLDEFLESIPFSETRNYVKRVMMLRASYKRLSQ
ncbi:MAG: lytic transglycosylase domain-containing protein [Acidobacteriota bacterium]|nr:lytic transglycosylase domain-containing protein [Acidobacteriota bacterium]